MSALNQYAILPLIGWGAGINIYLTVALVGIGGRAQWFDLPDGLQVLTNPLVIGLAILVYLIEFVADKIPLVDSLWDAVHTFIRPSGAALVGFMAGTDQGLVAQTLFALFTGTIALDMHAVKASTRLMINTSPEPFSNIAASLAEDAAVAGMFWFFIKHPILALILLALILVLTFFILRALWRFVLKFFRRPQPQTQKQAT